MSRCGSTAASARGRLRLYKRSGFRRIAPYYELPDDMKDWLVFFELEL